jgi:hypothetical protein
MKYLLTTIFAGFTIVSFAQKEIKISDARNHIGDSIKIFGKIFGGKYLEAEKGSPTFLSLGGPFPHSFLPILVWDDARKLFKKAPEEYYRGVLVCITGKIQMFNQKPLIIVTNPNQIQEIIIDKFSVNFPM